jgi:hypothetical protein
VQVDVGAQDPVDRLGEQVGRVQFGQPEAGLAQRRGPRCQGVTTGRGGELPAAPLAGPPRRWRRVRCRCRYSGPDRYRAVTCARHRSMRV